MTTIRKEFTLDADPDKVWEVVRDIGEVHRRLVPGVLTDAYLEGDGRVVTFANGMVARERVVGMDEQTRRFAYSVFDGLPGAIHHNASMEVLTDGAGGTRFVWITDVLPDELGPRVAELMELGAQTMRRTLR
ncbi:SRPBCC family protein [Nocardia sp. IFM 10818]